MTIEPIKGINLYKLLNIDKIRNKKGISPYIGKDEVIISEEAKRISELEEQVNKAKAKINELPDLRYEKIKEAKQRIKEGYYFSSAILDKIASILLSRK